MTGSAFADHALGAGLADRDELATIAAAWRDWAASPDGWFILTSGEILARPG